MRRGWIFGMLLLAGPGARVHGDPARLEPGRTVAAQLAAGEEHRLAIDVPEDQYLVVAVEAGSTALAAALEGRDASTLARGREHVFFVPGGRGRHVLRLHAEAAPASYKAAAIGTRAAPSQQERRLGAERRFVQARFLAADGTTDALTRAVQELETARGVWKGLRELGREAAVLDELGLLHLRLGATDAARGCLDDAERLWKATADPRGAAHNLRLRAVLETGAGRNAVGRDLAAAALEASRKLKDRPAQARALNARAAARMELVETREVLTDFTAALAISREVQDGAEEARALCGLGQVYFVLGEYRHALDALPRALDLARARDERASEAAGLATLGSVYLALGRDDDAERCFADALARAAGQSDRRLEVHALLNVGAVHERRGALPEALDAFGRAWDLSRILAHRGLEARARHRLGRIHALEGRHAEALEHYLAALELADGGGTPREAAAVRADLGRAQARHDPGKAIQTFARGAELAQASADRVQEAANLIGRAVVERQAGDLAAACTHAGAAVDRVESLRSETDSLALRSSHFASRQDYYELYIQCLMELDQAKPGAGHAGAALKVVERARARSLLDMLGEQRDHIRRSLPPDLLERERRVRAGLSSRAAQQLRPPPPAGTADDARKLAAEMRDLLREHEAIDDEIRRADPRYAALSDPAPLDVAAIQREVLDDDTALLSYSLAAERSHLWVVTRTSLSSHSLPPRAEIEAAARRLYAFLTNPRHRPESAVDAAGTPVPMDFEAAARALGDMLLGPLAAAPRARRLLVVADGALQYIPFAALPAPWPASPSDEGPALLLDTYEIVSAPSASVLAVLRAEAASRVHAEREVAVLADPVFEADDARVTAAAPPRALRTPADDEERLARLPHSRAEAEAVLRYAEPSRSLAALDFAARRSAVVGGSLAPYRIVHFATHGILNSRYPELSGLALSLVDEEGRPEDGFLTLPDIYSLDLHADLVVLSGCRTGVGPSIRGEGLVGVTRGFMYAGAPRVVSSLWSVSDRGTAELMEHLYKKMLGEGQAPAAALRAAQQALRRDARFRHPYYWSGFVLFGEWR